ncbi:MAG: putative hemolysin [Halomonadaceae bacterium]
MKGAGYISILIGMFLLGGCATGERADTQTSMRGAATEYCESIGGQSEVQETRLGSGRYCRLPGGQLENEWMLYRSERLDND